MGRKLGKAMSSVHWLLLATMVAVELLMSFSFLGYFHIEPISITIAYIPVLIAGALGGPAESLVVGCAFGLASMWKASATYVMDFDQLFSPFLSGHPWESLFLSVGARALFGLAVGLLYVPARKGKLAPLWMTLVSLAGSTIHAALVYTCLWVFFPETGYRPWDALARLATPSDLLTSLLTAAVVLLLFLGVRSRRWQSFTARMRRAMAVHMPERYNFVALAVAVAVMLVSGVAISLYFVQRMDQVLTINGIELSDDAYSDLTHLQLQFLLGLLSMALLVVLFMIFNRRYATFKAYEGTLDPLTGLMTRRAFFQTCSRVLREQQPQGGYFLMVDLDHLKEINDTFGHPEGERVIRQVGQCLKDSFGGQALAARMGGDEFALLLWEPISRQELEVALRHFTEKIHGFTWGDGRPVSCSAGALPLTGPCAPEELYRDADQLLYAAKQNGRDQFLIGEPKR